MQIKTKRCKAALVDQGKDDVEKRGRTGEADRYILMLRTTSSAHHPFGCKGDQTLSPFDPL
jgi:hypothetical protein